MGRRPLPRRPKTLNRSPYVALAVVSNGCSELEGTLPIHYYPFCHFTRPEGLSRSTCMPDPRRQRSF